ncbi:MAG: hypothetical protein JWM63_1653 [Gammaproteobacteria bacterium]|jgi:uncharacterized protein (DUF2267 family)|nr:hypothetical protein [Gammaproteobacteria bacterium]
MSITGLEVFDTTIHRTNSWLKDLMQVQASENRHAAYLTLRATLHALRDRLTAEEVAHLGAQLPMLIRGLYYEGWDPTDKPLKIRHKDQFLDHIRQELEGTDPIDPERAARAVFTLLSNRVSEGEIKNVKQLLPSEIRDLWPQSDQAP